LVTENGKDNEQQSIRIVTALRESRKKIMFTSDGNYTEFIDDIVDTKVHGFVMEPTTDMTYIAEKHGKTHAFIGNADTRILLSGTRGDIYEDLPKPARHGIKPLPLHKWIPQGNSTL
jgi:uroporphyrinogen-III decarboxylase